MKKYDIEPYEGNRVQRQFEKEEAYLRAKKKLDKLKGFYVHLTVYVVVNAFLIIMIAANSDADESFWNFGTFATAFFWGIGLLCHLLGVYGPGLIFGKNWEERKIKEYMDKDKQNWE